MEQDLASDSKVEKTSTERFIEAGRKIDLLIDVVRAQSLLDELGDNRRIISPEVESSIKEGIVTSADYELYHRARTDMETGVFFAPLVDAIGLELAFGEIVDKLPITESA